MDGYEVMAGIREGHLTGCQYCVFWFYRWRSNSWDQHEGEVLISNLPRGYIELSYYRIVLDNPKKNAILIDFGDNKQWIPRSQIDDIFEDDDTIILTEWIAKEKGLI